MNATERLNARLAMQPVDRPPNLNIMMTFAARHIGRTLHDYHLDHRVLVDANLAMVEDFGIDIVQAISDPYREAVDFGLEVDFPADDLPVSGPPLIQNLEDLKRLPQPDPCTSARMSDRLAAVRELRRQVGNAVPVMGWVEGALAEASDLRGMSPLLLDLYDNTGWVEELLERTAETSLAFARSQIEAGATMIGLGDAVGSQVSPRAYRRFALPYEKRVFDLCHEMGALARLHICGNTSGILADMVASGADIIDIDWMVNVDACAEAFGEGPAFSGNFDPVAILKEGSPEQVYQAALDCLQRGGPKSISNAGCEVPIGTPHANLDAQSRAIRDYAEQAQ